VIRHLGIASTVASGPPCALVSPGSGRVREGAAKIHAGGGCLPTSLLRDATPDFVVMDSGCAIVSTDSDFRFLPLVIDCCANELGGGCFPTSRRLGVAFAGLQTAVSTGDADLSEAGGVLPVILRLTARGSSLGDVTTSSADSAGNFSKGAGAMTGTVSSCELPGNGGAAGQTARKAFVFCCEEGSGSASSATVSSLLALACMGEGFGWIGDLASVAIAATFRLGDGLGSGGSGGSSFTFGLLLFKPARDDFGDGLGVRPGDLAVSSSSFSCSLLDEAALILGVAGLISRLDLRQRGDCGGAFSVYKCSNSSLSACSQASN